MGQAANTNIKFQGENDEESTRRIGLPHVYFTAAADDHEKKDAAAAKAQPLKPHRPLQPHDEFAKNAINLELGGLGILY